MHSLGDLNLLKIQVIQIVKSLLMSLLYPIENYASKVRRFFSKKLN